MKALLFSAGMGTRLRPFTDHHPKALATVGGKTLLEWNIRKLQRYGINDVVVNVHHFGGQIIELLEQEQGFGSTVEISDERNALLETGGALKKAASFFEKEPEVLVMNVDILSDIDISRLLSFHHSKKPLATLAVQQRHSSRYFLFSEEMELKGWENPSTQERRIPGGDEVDNLERRAFSGIQVLDRSFFDKIKFEGKFSVVDVYLDLCGQESILAWDHTGDRLLDVGKPESLELAAQMFPAYL